jgi:hypothetical protein
MATQKNRGLTKHITAHVETLPVGALVTHETVLKPLREVFPKLTDKAIMQALSYASHAGIIVPGEVRGTYRKPNGASGMQALISQCDKDLIDQLLDAMAKAEPALKRAAKVLAAVDSIK